MAGRTGLAHYSIQLRKWRLFGNETQEKDFIVTGGLLWWKEFIIVGCFNLAALVDEVGGAKTCCGCLVKYCFGLVP